MSILGLSLFPQVIQKLFREFFYGLWNKCHVHFNVRDICYLITVTFALGTEKKVSYGVLRTALY